MRAAVVTFPGSNRDRDLVEAFKIACGAAVVTVWHAETTLPPVDVVGIPGGFSYGDYLRCGAIAARSAVMREVAAFAGRGGLVLGICNGFQILVEAGLLPGALMRNRTLRFASRMVTLEVASDRSPFTSAYRTGQRIRVPVAHGDGNYRLDPEEARRLVESDRVAFRYDHDLNGSVDRIAGVLSEGRNVLGLMPHPEAAIEPIHGSTDGTGLFASLLASWQR